MKGTPSSFWVAAMGVQRLDLPKRGAVRPTIERPGQRQVSFRRRGWFVIGGGWRACARAGTFALLLISCLAGLLSEVANASPQDEGSVSFITSANGDRFSFARARAQLDGVERRLVLAQRVEAQPAEPEPPGRAEATGLHEAIPATAQSHAVQATSEAERVNQRLLLDQERQRGDKVSRELAAARAELDAARQIQAHTVQAIEIGIQQAKTLEQEREKANNLSRELSFLRAELEVARVAASKAMQASEAELKQERPPDQRNVAKRAVLQLISLRSELDAARSEASEATQSAAAETAQRQALERELKQEQDKTEALIVELGTLRVAASDAAKVNAADADQKQALTGELEKQRDRAERAVRMLTSLRSELEAARSAASEAARSAAAENAQRQTLERELKHEQNKAEALLLELGNLRAAAIETAKINASDFDQKQALTRELEKQRDRAEGAVRMLTSLQAELSAAQSTSSELAARCAADLEHKRALEREAEQQRSRADAFAREASSLKNERDAARAEASDKARIAEATSKTPREEAQSGGGETLPPKFVSIQDHLAAWSAYAIVTAPPRGEPSRASGQSGVQPADSPLPVPTASLPRPPNASITRGPDPPGEDAKVMVAAERKAAADASPRPPANEERLLARAGALLRQADITGARGLLEYVLGYGSAQAAFMLAETYDPQMLQAWDARGVAGDPRKARQLYERAQAGGIQSAEGRIKALK